MYRVDLWKCLPLLVLVVPCSAAEESGTVILHDEFNREEKVATKEDVGNDWGTNSRSRAQGVKQVDLVDGAMHIYRAKVADHGVSVTHEAAFCDATIELRFKLDSKSDDLGINIADMKEKSVHAGHICMARIRPNRLEITDLKTGRMDLETRKRRLAKSLTEADQKRIKKMSKYQKLDLKTGQWHSLKVQIAGTKMTVSIDGKKAGEFESPGIGHPTKSRLRLAVNKQAWVDDVKITKYK